MTREQFEALVRAGAIREYPEEVRSNGFASYTHRHGPECAAYIAARMEHEWPLVEALQDILGDLDRCDWTCERCREDYRMQDTDIHMRSTEALSPYTTKPIER